MSTPRKKKITSSKTRTGQKIQALAIFKHSGSTFHVRLWLDRFVAFLYKKKDTYFCRYPSTAGTEEDLVKLIKKSFNPKNGLLAPNGKFYPTFFGYHCELSHYLGYSDWEIMEKNGWVYLSEYSGWRKPPSITQKQIDFIYKFSESHGNKPRWLKNAEEIKV